LQGIEVAVKIVRNEIPCTTQKKFIRDGN